MKNEIDSYGFTWPGKIESLIEAGRPTDKTLRPILQDSVNFDSTENIYIEGDNLDALKIILKSYMRRVKMIYIDPPYNTGNDFVFRDDFSQSEEESQRSLGFEDDSGRNYSSEIYRDNKKSNPRFHSEWCSMIYPRLKLAHMLLSDDGVIFISIDDNEQAKLRMICDEIFGENNFIGCILWNSTKSVTSTALISVSHTYNLVYCKDINYFTLHRTEFRLPDDGEGFKNPDNDPRGPWKADPFQVGGWRPNQQYEITNPNTGKIYTPNPGCSWKNDYEHFQELLRDNRIVFGTTGEGSPQRKRFQYEAQERGRVAKTWWDDVDTNTNATQQLRKFFDNKIIFSNPKPVDLIMKFLQLATTPDSIILDFFAGSSTTAHAVMSLNAQDSGRRKFIMIQIAEPCPEKSEARKAGYATISQIGRERIRRAGENLMCDNQQLTTNNYTLDIGFRAFRVESSNYRNIFMYPDELSQENISDMAENIKHDRSDMDLLFMCVANFGLPLSLPYHTEIADGFTVHIYGDNDIAACFGENISEEAVKFVAKLKAGHSVFRESCFDGVCSRINLEQIFDAYSDGKKMMIL